MKDTFVLCTAVCVLTTLVRIILSAAACERVAKVLQTLLDILLLILLVGAFFGVDLNQYGGISLATEDFEDIESRTVAEIKTQAENLLAERISDAVENEFSQRPSACVADINIESLEISELSVYFDIRLISGYDVKRFIKEKYKVDAEVIFH